MLQPIEAELLTASFAPGGEALACNTAWRSVLGSVATPWARLSDEDQSMASAAIVRAATGSLITNQVVSAHSPQRDEPLPVLLNFIPVHRKNAAAEARGTTEHVQAVTVTGEVMAEPSTWMISQTQRHRMEALGRMTMGVAHDLNNLLSGLIGHLELIRQRIPRSEDTAAFRSSLSTVERAAEDGAALISKLQRYIRQDTQVHFEPLDLPTLIQDCIELTQPYWYNEPRRTGIDIDIEKALEPVPPVMGSASELREVFVNLILNAVQAMPKGGVLTFRTYVDDNDDACVTVSDTGMGMSEEVRRHIFEPLFTTKGEQGTGMGLAASYGIVQEHEGTIEVHSERGEGTRFVLRFPTSTRPLPDADGTEAGAADEPPSPEERPARVLIVDDEEMVRSIITQLLLLKGHTVRTASSGPEALECVEQESFDIVFTDFGMPEMSGADLAQTLRTSYPELPVVLLTGYTEPDAAVQHVQAVLSKPFKLKELQSTIQQLVFQNG